MLIFEYKKPRVRPPSAEPPLIEYEKDPTPLDDSIILFLSYPVLGIFLLPYIFYNISVEISTEINIEIVTCLLILFGEIT